jgi:hypothetical protein
MTALVRNEGRDMNGKAKKILKSLICAGIVILAVVIPAKATFVDANAVDEGLEYYIRINKGVYDLGEAIEMLCKVTNVSDQTLNVSEPTLTYTVNFELTRPEGDILFAPAWITRPRPPGLPDIITLNPGEYIEKLYDITLCEWGSDGQVVEEPFSILGHYSIISEYDNRHGGEGPLILETGPLDLEIIPEPASVFLLGMGSVFLLFRQKGKVKCLN